MSKTLMSYPRSYYAYVLFYILINALLPHILFLDLVCIAGARVVYRNFLEMQKRRSENRAAISRSCNVAKLRDVATFQRRDVATSRCLANSNKSQRAAQCRDVPAISTS